MMSKLMAIAALLVIAGPSFAGVWVPRAPEIDPASATAWLTILGGTLAVIYGRRGKKS
jgi:hypothetical protein